jgi:diguanylate cyclase
MDYFDSHEQAVEYAKEAMAQMPALGVAPTPRNYRIWYEYASGRNAALRAALDVLVSNSRELTEPVIDDIYLQFFTASQEGERIREITSKLESTVNEVMETISIAGTGSKQFGKVLNGFSGDVQSIAPGANLKTLIANMISETKAMIRINSELQDKLQNSSSEIGHLRMNLAAIRREALTDPLTGLSNRKSFDVSLGEAAKAAMEDGKDLSLLLLDIDHFKRFNDTWGHQVGDQVLKLVARTIRDNTRGQDTSSRYGGEEFAIILPATPLSGAVTVANTIREALMTKQLVKKSTGQDMGNVTASIGVSVFEPGEPLSELIRRADGALYTAKRDGRNKVVSQDALDKLLAVAS